MRLLCEGGELKGHGIFVRARGLFIVHVYYVVHMLYVEGESPVEPRKSKRVHLIIDDPQRPYGFGS